MIIQCHMLAFYQPDEYRVREIDIPDELIIEDLDNLVNHSIDLLGLGYKYGQNMFQNRPCASVSIGDVIEVSLGIHEGLYEIKPVGFSKITTEKLEELKANSGNPAAWLEMTQEERQGEIQ